MSDLDVLIVGGYSPSDTMGGYSSTIRDSIRLSYKNHYAGLDFIKYLVRGKGDLEYAEKNFQEANNLKQISRPLNAIYLYDYLTKNGLSVDIVNYFQIERKKFDDLIKSKPKAVAISTTFITDGREIATIAKAIRENSPDTKIIAGGIKILKSFKKFTLLKEGYFEGFNTDPMLATNFFVNTELDKAIDVFIIEECGELTLLEILKKIKKGNDYKSTPNIAWRENGKLNFNPRVHEPYTFEKNIISWDKIPKELIGWEIPVMAGIGCPFKCTFCDFTGLHKVKLRSIDNVIEELKLIQKTYPGIPVYFTDDNLFTNKHRTKELAEAIVKNDLKFKWRAFFRSDAISEDNAEILAKSGCMVALLGIESGDNSILKNMVKRTTREQNLKAVQLLNANGISTISTMIIGFPGETKETVDNTIDLLNSYPDVKLPINKYYPLVFCLLPLSPISSPDNRKKFKITGGYENWSHATMNSDQAKEEYVRFFKKVAKPAVSYLEFIDPEIPVGKIVDIGRERDNIVKSGINQINKDNVSVVYNRFNKILS
jgi:anaerobic magnesium-protoporphyrin IX monomethyl ester cyclase